MFPNTVICANTLIFTGNTEQTLADDSEKENTQTVMHFLGLNHKRLSTLILWALERVFFSIMLSYRLYGKNKVPFEIWLNNKMVDFTCNGMSKL